MRATRLTSLGSSPREKRDPSAQLVNLYYRLVVSVR